MKKLSQALKWDFKTHKYKPYTLPRGVLLVGLNNQISSCAGCGKPIIFGKSYTSLAIHTKIGIGYPVCKLCYLNEISEKNINN